MCDVLSSLKFIKTGHHKSAILKELHNIRLAIGNDSKEQQKLFNDNVIQDIIKLLTVPSCSIVNICLSILTECCSLKNNTRQVVSDILPSIHLMLHDCNNKTESIYYRCCKLLGNIAKNSDCCFLLHENRATDIVIMAINNGSSNNTQLAAIRVLRLLWANSTYNDRILMLQRNFLKPLVKLLKSEDTTVLNSVFQLIYLMVQCKYEAVVVQMFEAEIMATLLNHVTSEMVGHIILTLSRRNKARLEFAKLGIMETLINQLQKIHENSNKLNTSLVMSLCNLCQEPLCRSRLRYTNDAFSVLLQILSTDTDTVHLKCVLSTINYFMYDEIVTTILIKKNMIRTLIKHLQRINLQSDRSHKSKRMFNVNNRPPSMSPTDSRISPIMFSPNNSPIANDEVNLGSSEIYSSQNSSPLSVYSPLCSDSEFNDDAQLGEDNVSVNSEEESTAVSTLPQNPEDQGFLSDVDIGTLILDLIRQITYVNVPVMEFSLHATWDTLLDYLVLVHKDCDRVLFILSMISRNGYYVSELLKSNFPLVLHRKLCRPIHNDCDECDYLRNHGMELLDHFSLSVQSGLGSGILRFELNKTNGCKIIASIITPYITRDIVELNDFITRYSILDAIIDALVDGNDELFQDALASLHAMVVNILKISNPQSPYESHDICLGEDITAPDVCPEIFKVLFRLDDDSVVECNKKKLSELSPVFRAMLFGDFAETDMKEIRLVNVTAESLQLLQKSANCIANKDYCNCALTTPLSVLLETIVQADRFLVANIGNKIIHMVMNNVLSYKNCHVIYNWAQRAAPHLTDMKDVGHNVILYLLAGDMSFRNRSAGMKSLLKLKFRDEIKCNIRTIITDNIRDNLVAGGTTCKSKHKH